jgi:Icc-related predicted phosphoesterase
VKSGDARRFLFASDLHGRKERYEKLFTLIDAEHPQAVLLGGDLLPTGLLRGVHSRGAQGDFLQGYLLPALSGLRVSLKEKYPAVFFILGNDDARQEEKTFLRHIRPLPWTYLHMRKTVFAGRPVFGYSCVPPTPFLLKDWERYDVSRFVDPGCVPPEEGRFSIDLAGEEKGLPTIQEDLERLAAGEDLGNAIFLFHSPPYHTRLDRAALDGLVIDGAPMDVHVGSIAIRRFIEARQPKITLHGHVHESARLSGSWQDRIGQTFCFSAAHDGPELSVVTFDPSAPEKASRRLL